MARPCTVCAHSRCAAIHWRLFQQVPRRAIAREFGLSEASVRRHARRHLPESYRRLMARAPEVATAFLELLPSRLERVVADLESQAALAPRRRAVERCAAAVADLAEVFTALTAFSRTTTR